MTMNMPVTPTKKPRYGTFKIKIGSNHIIKTQDGIQRQFKVRDKSRHPKANVVCVCLYCKKTFADEETLLSEHPENRILEKQEEAHVYGWWSDDPIEPSTDEKQNKLAVKSGKVLGLLSDEELQRA